MNALPDVIAPRFDAKPGSFVICDGVRFTLEISPSIPKVGSRRTRIVGRRWVAGALAHPVRLVNVIDGEAVWQAGQSTFRGTGALDRAMRYAVKSMHRDVEAARILVAAYDAMKAAL